MCLLYKYPGLEVCLVVIIRTGQLTRLFSLDDPLSLEVPYLTLLTIHPRVVNRRVEPAASALRYSYYG
jgi:hypothetical protein